MTAADREFALKTLDVSRERLVAAVRGLSREQLEFRPAADRWSVAENLEHVIVAETFVLGTLQRLVQQAPERSRRGRWEGRDELLAKRVAEDRENLAQSPEVFRPTGRWPLEKLVPEFTVARALTREFAASTQEDLRARFFRHPAAAIGEIDSYQWLLLIGAHCDRHRAQSEGVIASFGFPDARAV